MTTSSSSRVRLSLFTLFFPFFRLNIYFLIYLRYISQIIMSPYLLHNGYYLASFFPTQRTKFHFPPKPTKLRGRGWIPGKRNQTRRDRRGVFTGTLRTPPSSHFACSYRSGRPSLPAFAVPVQACAARPVWPLTDPGRGAWWGFPRGMGCPAGMP